MGFLQRSGLGQAQKIRYQKSRRTHVQNRCGCTLSPRASAQKQSLPLPTSSLKLRRSSYPVSDEHVLCQNFFVETTRFGSVLADADASLRTSFGQERPGLVRWKRVGRFMYEAPSGLDLKKIQCVVQNGFPERVVHKTDRFRLTQQPRSPRPSLALFARSCHHIRFFWAQAQ